MYKIIIDENAQKDLLLLQKHSPRSIAKLRKLLAEIAEHPRTGTGQVERLKHCAEETWSRRITREHRIVYQIHDNEILVLVLSVFGHY
ncbi:MAG: Txe/YoeB family addiction module toxin [Paludibacteraceae bacterium]|nr:Txe/YoeB family addiction module toxin [Paludibacteraceae bacterium]